MPKLKLPGESYAISDGILNEAMVRSELSANRCITFGSHDTKAVIAFAVELMDRMKSSYLNLMERNPEEIGECQAGRAETTCDKRMARGSVAFVRVDISERSDGIRVSLSMQNPRDVVGCTEELAGYIAQGFADNLIAIRDDISHVNGARAILIEGDNCQGIFARAQERNRLRELVIEMKDCERRKGNLCSPIKPTCPFYHNGNCTWH